jgi:hypothetical protein
MTLQTHLTTMKIYDFSITSMVITQEKYFNTILIWNVFYFFSTMPPGIGGLVSFFVVLPIMIVALTVWSLIRYYKHKNQKIIVSTATIMVHSVLLIFCILAIALKIQSYKPNNWWHVSDLYTQWFTPVWLCASTLCLTLLICYRYQSNSTSIKSIF